jgi:hypothetical protein
MKRSLSGRRPIQIGILPPIQDARLLAIEYSPEPPHGREMLKKAREALAARIRRASLGDDAEKDSVIHGAEAGVA